MGSVFIESAFYGDEKATRNVTSILKDKILGTTLDVDVNNRLIPPFTVAEKAVVTNEEEQRITAMATTQCGGIDKECIDATKSRLMQENLAQKQRAANDPAQVIKGPRLTLNVIENGKRVRKVVPDGQKFKLENVAVSDPRKGPLQVPPLQYFQNQLYLLAGLVLATLVYAFSVIATYTVFYPRLGPLIAIPATVVSVFIPYSGYVMILLYFAIMRAVKTYVGD